MTVVRSESDESKTTIVLFMNIYIAMYNLLYTWDEKAIKHFERRLGYVNLLHLRNKARVIVFVTE